MSMLYVAEMMSMDIEAIPQQYKSIKKITAASVRNSAMVGLWQACSPLLSNEI